MWRITCFGEVAIQSNITTGTQFRFGLSEPMGAYAAVLSAASLTGMNLHGTSEIE